MHDCFHFGKAALVQMAMGFTQTDQNSPTTLHGNRSIHFNTYLKV